MLESQYQRLYDYITDNKYISIIQENLKGFSGVFNEVLDDPHALFQLFTQQPHERIKNAYAVALDYYITRLDEFETYLLKKKCLETLANIKIMSHSIIGWSTENLTLNFLSSSQQLQGSQPMGLKFTLVDSTVAEYRVCKSQFAKYVALLKEHIESKKTQFKSRHYQNYLSSLEDLLSVLQKEHSSHAEIIKVIDKTSKQFSNEISLTEKNFDIRQLNKLIQSHQDVIGALQTVLDDDHSVDLFAPVTTLFEYTNKDIICARYSPPDDLKTKCLIRDLRFCLFDEFEDELNPSLNRAEKAYKLFEMITTIITTSTAILPKKEPVKRVSFSGEKQSVASTQKKIRAVRLRRAAANIENLSLNFNLIPTELERTAKNIRDAVKSGLDCDKKYTENLLTIAHNLEQLSRKLKQKMQKLQSLRKSSGDVPDRKRTPSPQKRSSDSRWSLSRSKEDSPRGSQTGWGGLFRRKSSGALLQLAKSDESSNGFTKKHK